MGPAYGAITAGVERTIYDHQHRGQEYDQRVEVSPICDCDRHDQEDNRRVDHERS